jgi:hypothetical protein
METVKELRGATWVAFLLEKGEFKSLADMHKALGVVENVQLWSAYKSGKASPQETTVKLVDRVVPGSASTWFNGLHDLPLWAVLEGDMAVCQQVISDLLNAYVEPEPWMSLARRPVASMGDSERLKALLEVVLPRSLWQLPTSSMRYNPNAPHKMELSGWLSLSELFSRVENPLAVLYRQDKLKAGEENILKSFVYGMVAKLGGQQAFANKSASNLTNPAYVLAFISLIQICNESRDKALSPAPAFLKQGIKESVIDTFGSDVALFIETM